MSLGHVELTEHSGEGRLSIGERAWRTQVRTRTVAKYLLSTPRSREMYRDEGAATAGTLPSFLERSSQHISAASDSRLSRCRDRQDYISQLLSLVGFAHGQGSGERGIGGWGSRVSRNDLP